MKGIISFGLLCLFFVCSVTSTGSIAKNHLRSREECSLQCQTTGPDSKNWLLEIDTKIYLVYNNDQNYFGIFNAKLQFAIIYDGTSGIVALINIKTGGAILINIETNLALYVKGSGSIDFSTNVYAGFEIAFKIILDNKDKVTGEHDVNSGFYFNFIVIISGSLEITLKDRKELLAALKADFNAIFEAIQQLIVDGVVGIAIGSAVIVAVVIEVTKEASDLIRSIFAFIITLSRDLYGKFEARLFAEFKKIVQKGTDQLIKLVNAIQAVGNVFKNIADALDNYLTDAILQVEIVYQKVGDKLYEIRKYLTSKGQWVIEFKLLISRESVLIIYNSKLNVFAVVNKTSNIAVLVIGGKAYFAVVSLSTGLVIKVGSIAGTAVIVEKKTTEIVQSFKEQDFAAALKIVVEVTESIDFSLNVFNFVLLLANIGNESALKLQFALQHSLLVKLKANFKSLFDYNKSIKGAFGIIGVVFGNIKIETAVSGVISLLVKINSSFKGWFSSNLFISAYASFTEYIDSNLKTGLFSKVTKSIESLVGLVINGFTDVIKSGLKIASDFGLKLEKSGEVDLAGSFKVSGSASFSFGVSSK